LVCHGNETKKSLLRLSTLSIYRQTGRVCHGSVTNGGLHKIQKRYKLTLPEIRRGHFLKEEG
jgi:hypothetical protein